jgi:pimeloyl-ACP methyl ester carboxylesterase
MHFRRSGLAALAALFTVTACTADGSTRPAEISLAEWREGDLAGLVDIGGGRTLYLECRGTGSPTVVLESGFADAGDTWSLAGPARRAVDPEVSTFTRLCTYDRPGTVLATAPPTIARSGGAPGLRTAGDVVADLHDLLVAAEVPGPYVLAGHSLGGLFARLYASTYPDEVTGLVLADTAWPDVLRDRLTSQQWDELRRGLRTPASIPLLDDTGVIETYDLDVSIAEVRSAPPVQHMPAVVLSSSDPDRVADRLPSRPILDALTRSRAVWAEHQKELAALVPGARHVLAPSGHYIHQQRPDLVIEAIRHVVDLNHAPLPPR